MIDLSLERLLDDAPFGAHYYELAPEGRLVFTGANRTADRILGFDHGRLVGLPLETAFPGPLTQADIIDAYRRVAEHGVPYAAEHLDRENGVIRAAFEVRALPAGPRRVVALFTDVTERKRSEQALRQSEARYRTLFDHSLDAVFLTTTNGRVLEANPAAAVMFGRSAEELRRDGRDGVMDATDPRLAAALEQRRRTGRFKGELTCLRADGTRFPAEVTSVVLGGPPDQERASVVVRDVTERWETEAALRESEERFARLAEAAFEGIVLVDRGRILDLNQQLARMLGYEPGEMIGADPLGFVAPESRELVRGRIAEGAEGPYEHMARRKDGSAFPVEVRAKSLPYGGRPVRVSAIRDITDRKEADSVLLDVARGVSGQTGTRFLRSLVEHLTRALRADIALVAELVPDRPDRARTLALWADGKEGENFEYDLAHTPCEKVVGQMLRAYPSGVRELFPDDGLARAMEAEGYVGTPLFDSSKRTIGLLVVVFRKPIPDLPQAETLTQIFASRAAAELERLGVEEAQRESEARYRQLVESAQDAIYTLSPEGTITSLNPAFERMTGWSRAEWLGRPFTELVHPDDLPLDLDRPGEGAALTVELRIRTRSGALVTGEFTTTPQVDEGRLVGLLGIARDVTQRKALEEQIRQAQKMESVGLLAGGIAHDFNNILGIILGNAGLLRKQAPEADELRRRLGAITTAAHRGAELVRALLTFARKTEARSEPVRLNDVVQETVRLLAETLPSGISIGLSLAPELPRVLADANQLQQVLLNLSVNARDAMPRGGTLSFATRGVARGALPRKPPSLASEYLCLEVADTGTGMDEATQSRIFEPFFTTKEVGKGTGLGLAVVFGIVERHQGFIHVESRPGVGSAFQVYLPTPEQRPGQDRPEEATAAAQLPGNETLLVVEDEPMLADLLATILADAGYAVVAARDGEEAVALFEARRREISLVLCDLGLPKCDGEEVLLRVQQIDARVPLLVASGFLEPDRRARLVRAGAHQVLQKPYLADELLHSVRQALDARPPEERRGTPGAPTPSA